MVHKKQSELIDSFTDIFRNQHYYDHGFLSIKPFFFLQIRLFDILLENVDKVRYQSLSVHFDFCR